MRADPVALGREDLAVGVIPVGAGGRLPLPAPGAWSALPRCPVRPGDTSRSGFCPLREASESQKYRVGTKGFYHHTMVMCLPLAIPHLVVYNRGHALQGVCPLLGWQCYIHVCSYLLIGRSPFSIDSPHHYNADSDRRLNTRRKKRIHNNEIKK